MKNNPITNLDQFIIRETDLIRDIIYPTVDLIYEL